MKTNFKVYVTLGLHVNFYHSWRGDTPDEAGFGTDMRVIRGILDILDRAQATGMTARVYWDVDAYWTLQTIIPEHCPDILERIRARVSAGMDEVILGPFNNGANHAATPDEFRAAVTWAIENPWGSGLKQQFGRVAPFYRPQECMFTTGHEALLKACGIEGVLLYYSLTPFNTLGAFLPPLPLEDRFNPLWFRTREDQPPLVLFPCLGLTDLFEFVSLEDLMLDLHARQQRGEIRSDVLVHLNADADLETWLPVRLPRFLRWFPNTGGIEEYLRVVHKYPWAELTVPSAYLADHPPRREVLVRQDLADGGFDGNYSWAEKFSSLLAWTALERSRLASLRAEVLAQRSGLDLSDMLWEGSDSVFFQRLIGLSTTHFGMSTPIINEERQARALALLNNAAARAEAAERRAAHARKATSPLPKTTALYAFELVPAPPRRHQPIPEGHVAVSLPIVLPSDIATVRLERTSGAPVPASLTDVRVLPDGRKQCHVRFVAAIGGQADYDYRLLPSAAPLTPPPTLTQLRNRWLEILFSTQSGIASFRYLEREIGGPDFLKPFITYKDGSRGVTYLTAGFSFRPLSDETWDGLQRVCLRATIPMRTHRGNYESELLFVFTLFDALPYLYVDATVRYAYTPPTDVIHNMLQKLRRLMDLNWIETAPFQITPCLDPPQGRPLRIWKHNHLGITAYYDLNYGAINPRNRQLDAFNHQVTNGWVAVSDGQMGLLVGQDASTLASMAFCPMRLRQVQHQQVLSLNPFGSYYGRMLDYQHLGGNGIGARLLTAFSGALRPNGPSYNGQTLRFSLMLAPYAGDAPPDRIQTDAGLHFYPPGAVIHHAPAGIEADLAESLRASCEAEARRQRLIDPLPLSPPTAFLCNPVSGGVVLVWDAPPGNLATGYEVAFRREDETAWQTRQVEATTRLFIPGLKDGVIYHFKVRALCEAPEQGRVRCSAWTAEQIGIPGATQPTTRWKGMGRLPVGALAHLVLLSLWTVIRRRIKREIS
ncbi:MAG: hypothetical protein D6709_00110 [Chloroflexi bacterium]|nr:MAG: hypothetical protein D6709_00110 [Chloroflexota bacterium]